MAEIFAQDVRKIFKVKNNDGLAEEMLALDNFNLEVRNGEFLALLGPSGCGKSTFLNILAGLTGYDGGTVTIDGQSVLDAKLNRGVVFQSYALFPWRTVLENVEIGLEIRGVGKRERKDAASHYLGLVGLENFANRHPHQLSGGMKQRVAIARSLAYEPDILLMDEPFAALDAQTRELLQVELLRIWEKSARTIVFVTHSIDEALFLADRVAVMTARPGRIKEIMEIDLLRPRTEEARNSSHFADLRQYAWSLIKDEVRAAQEISGATDKGSGGEKKRGGLDIEKVS
jgi:NitT/TauT family transport system ATP-binding protein